MTHTLLNRTTATRDNALTEEERDAFLSEKRIGRLGTNRGDGWSHVTPIWYVWEGGKFLLSLGKSRRHLRNIAADPHVTLCVDDDPRMTDLSQSPRSVVCFGTATLHDDEATTRRVTEKVELRYLPAEVRGPELDELLWFEGRTVVEIEPVRWLAWDQGKGD
jgi:PPOX class probable F420-dependent enzyme